MLHAQFRFFFHCTWSLIRRPVGILVCQSSLGPCGRICVTLLRCLWRKELNDNHTRAFHILFLRDAHLFVHRCHVANDNAAKNILEHSCTLDHSRAFCFLSLSLSLSVFSSDYHHSPSFGGLAFWSSNQSVMMNIFSVLDLALAVHFKVSWWNS